MTKALDLYELIMYLNHPDKLIRETTYTQLVELGVKAVPEIVNIFPQVSGQARLQVVKVLGEIGSEEASALLVELVISTDPDEYLFVSSMSAKALGQIGDIEALIRLLDAERAGPRRMAATVLRNLCAVESVPGLVGGLNDEDSTVRETCADALACIDTPEARQALDQR